MDLGTVLCLVSAVAVFVHSSAFERLGNILSLLFYQRCRLMQQHPVCFRFAFSCYTVVSCVVYIIIDSMLRFQPKAEGETTRKLQNISPPSLLL